jgi:hypothetical protein
LSEGLCTALAFLFMAQVQVLVPCELEIAAVITRQALTEVKVVQYIRYQKAKVVQEAATAAAEEVVALVVLVALEVL